MVRVSQGAHPLIQSHWIKHIDVHLASGASFFIAPSLEAMAFIPMLFNYICAEKKISLITLSVREKSMRDMKEILESTFLGQAHWYGIWDLELVSKNTISTFVDYLMQYKGPHILIICSSADSSFMAEIKKSAFVVPTELSTQQVAGLSTVLPPRLFNAPTLQLIATRDASVPFVSLLAAMPYIPVLGRALIPLFKEQYLPRLIKSDMGSLFAFTDLLWQRKIAAFYAYWAEIRGLYAPQFWLSFWSDQFFRAYAYSYCMKRKETALAQQVAARKLSFIYIKSTWQSVPLDLLITVHEMIYRIDYSSKSGGTTDMIEYIYQRWFTEVH